jgi:hypothetical protein
MFVDDYFSALYKLTSRDMTMVMKSTPVIISRFASERAHQETGRISP